MFWSLSAFSALFTSIALGASLGGLSWAPAMFMGFFLLTFWGIALSEGLLQKPEMLSVGGWIIVPPAAASACMTTFLLAPLVLGESHVLVAITLVAFCIAMWFSPLVFARLITPPMLESSGSSDS